MCLDGRVANAIIEIERRAIKQGLLKCSFQWN